VSGLNGVMFNDIMDNIEWFFNLHDKNKDGHLTKDEILTLSETFLVSLRLFLSLVLDLTLSNSSSSVMRSVTLTWVQSAGS